MESHFWINREEFDYANWAPGEPVGLSENRYAEIVESQSTIKLEIVLAIGMDVQCTICLGSRMEGSGSQRAVSTADLPPCAGLENARQVNNELSLVIGQMLDVRIAGPVQGRVGKGVICDSLNGCLSVC